MNKLAFNAMGGEILVFSDNLKANDFIREEIIRLISIFNFFDDSSNLSLLNKNRIVPYQKDLAFLLEESLYFKELSDGLFNIFLGNQIRARKQNALLSENSSCELEITDSEIKLIGDCDIDLGGIAKGYIIDVALQSAKERFGDIDLLIDARGDCVFSGNGNKFISVENPFNESEQFDNVFMSSGAIVTSGHNKQKFKEGSHILGQVSDILTISLVSKTKNCYELDALATYFIQLDSQDALEKIELDNRFDDIDCLIVLNDGSVLKSMYWGGG